MLPAIEAGLGDIFSPSKTMQTKNEASYIYFPPNAKHLCIWNVLDHNYGLVCPTDLFYTSLEAA